MRSVYLQVSLLPTPYFAVITAHYYLCNFSACSTVNKNSLKKTRQKENNEICVCNCIYDCLIDDYLATLLHSATSSPVVIHAERTSLHYTCQAVCNEFHCTHCKDCLKQLSHRRMPSSVCTASLSSRLHSGQIRALL